MLTVSPGLLNRISGGCHVSYVKQSQLYPASQSIFMTLLADIATLCKEIRWGLGQAVNPANLESFLTVSRSRHTVRARCGVSLGH